MYQPLFPFRNAMNTMNAIRSPRTMLNQMIMQNPQMKQAMEYINANGGDPKSAFYKLADEMGVDPDEVLKAMRNA